MSSRATGIQSTFLHPVEALHGDLGSISPHGVDVLILVSYSGKTAELLSLIKSLRKDPPPHQHCHAIISLTTPNSPLAQASDVSLDVSLEKDEEADPAVPAPTSSVLAALAMLDSLALTLLRERVGWDADPVERKATFREFHPGGECPSFLSPSAAGG
jgi:D-arabinose 5-phosphate isomerase GutQ